MRNNPQGKWNLIYLKITFLSTTQVSTLFISQGCFAEGLRMSLGYLTQEAVATWSENTTRWTFWFTMSNYSFPAQSVGRPNKHKKWCCDSQVFFKPTWQIRLREKRFTKSTISPSNLRDYLHESKVSRTGVSDINIYSYITIESRSRVGKTFNDSTRLGNSYLFSWKLSFGGD